jgi:hypothetical protein
MAEYQIAKCRVAVRVQGSVLFATIVEGRDTVNSRTRVQRALQHLVDDNRHSPSRRMDPALRGVTAVRVVQEALQHA